MKKLTTALAASAVAISTAWTAAADGNTNTSFPLTNSCAEEALEEVFHGPLDIITTEDGLAFSKTKENSNNGAYDTVSAIISLKNGFLSSTNVQLSVGKEDGSQTSASYISPYGTSAQPPKLVTDGNPIVDDITIELSKRLDSALEECRLPQTMAGAAIRIPSMG